MRLPRLARPRALAAIAAACVVLSSVGAGWVFRQGALAALQSVPALAPVLHMAGLDGGGDAPPALRTARPEPGQKVHGIAHVATPGDAADMRIAPAAAASRIIQDMRKLERAQNALAAGRADAGRTQKDLLLSLHETILSTAPDNLSPPDALAIATYVLSGGSPAVARHALKGRRLPVHVRTVLLAAAQYVEGKLDDAATSFADIKVDLLPPRLAARLLLALAQLPGHRTDEERLELLQQAADRLPGSLVEEAALRRAIATAIKAAGPSRFLHVTGRYLRRYPQSLYAGGIDSVLVDGVLSFEAHSQPVAESELDRIVMLLPAPRRATALDDLAARSLRQGRVRLCLYATSRKRHLVAEGTPDDQRRQLYQYACQAVLSRGEVSARLAGLDPRKLDAEDQALLNSVKAVSRMMTKGSAQVPVDDHKPVPADVEPETASLKASVAQQLEATQNTLRRVKP